MLKVRILANSFQTWLILLYSILTYYVYTVHLEKISKDVKIKPQNTLNTQHNEYADTSSLD